MTCDACGGATLEFVGLTPDAVARLCCTRCGRVLEQAVDTGRAAAPPQPRTRA